MSEKVRVLVVDDNAQMRDMMSECIRMQDFAEVVGEAGNGVEAVEKLEKLQPDIIILDLIMPMLDGIGVLERIPDLKIRKPHIIVLSAIGHENIIQEAMSLGVEYYMVKPFAMEELIARIKALLRRPGAALGVQLNLGNVTLDTTGPSLLVDGKRAGVTRRELALLEILLRRPGNVVNRNMIEDGIYGFDDEVGTNALEVLVSRLRKKLMASGADIQLHTVRGVGYMVMEPS